MLLRRLSIVVVVLIAVWSSRARADEPAAAEDPTERADDQADEQAPASPEVQKEFDEAFKGEPHEVGEEAAAEGSGAEAPAITADQMHAMVRAARDKVLAKLEAKIVRTSSERMGKISLYISLISLAGVFLLLMPLFLRKKYPNQLGQLFKYSALAAVTFFVTVNLFGVVALGFRGAQSALSKQTNPQIKIAEAFFNAIDDNVDEFLPVGKSLFAPTLYQLQTSDEQPTVALIENGQKLIKDASVFVTIAHMFKKLDFVFALLPIVLLLVTMVLFVLAIKPTLLEIIRLPATAAATGGGGRVVIRNALRRVGSEMLATLCTIGVLLVLSLLGAVILGQVVKPALFAILEFFGTAVIYLQIQPDASTGLVFWSLFGVIMFLVLNLAAIILAMSFFLGKAQKIFQRRFHDHVPLAKHIRFWTWGSASVVFAQLLPLGFMLLGAWLLERIETTLIGDGTAINWSAVMLAGPAVLVGGFLFIFWSMRGLAALTFLMKYKVPPAPPPPRQAQQMFF